MNQTAAGVLRLLSSIDLLSIPSAVTVTVIFPSLSVERRTARARPCHGLLFRKEAEPGAVSGRLQDACFQLRHSDRSIDEIMDLLGITGRGYFFSLFRQETGMTPKQYRTKFRQ